MRHGFSRADLWLKQGYDGTVVTVLLVVLCSALSLMGSLGLGMALRHWRVGALAGGRVAVLPSHGWWQMIVLGPLIENAALGLSLIILLTIMRKIWPTCRVGFIGCMALATVMTALTFSAAHVWQRGALAWATLPSAMILTALLAHGITRRRVAAAFGVSWLIHGLHNLFILLCVVSSSAG
jgi:hypothetical protein